MIQSLKWTGSVCDISQQAVDSWIFESQTSPLPYFLCFKEIAFTLIRGRKSNLYKLNDCNV
jgi:hypothetical protein